jgi:predicted Zn-dependent protease
MSNGKQPHRKLLLSLSLVALACAYTPACADEVSDKRRQLSMIELLVRAGRHDEAARQMRALFPAGPPPGGELALQYYDVIGHTQDGWPEARAGLERLVKVDPYNVNYRLALAQQLARHANTRRDGFQMFAALAKRPNLDKQWILGQWRRALGDLGENADNVALYRDYLAVDPQNSEVRSELAKAEQASAKAKREAAKTLPWKMRRQANAQAAAGHPQAAIAIFNNALKLDPQNPWVRFDLARLYQAQGAPEKGHTVMQAGLAAAPGNADMLYASALYASLADQPQQALQLLDRMPASRRSPAMRRLVQEVNGQLNAPRQQRAAGSANPAVWKLRDRADTQLAAGHPDAAIATLQQALAADPGNAWVRFDLARLYYKQGNQQQGTALMDAGLARAPADPDLLYADALYLSLQDEAEHALQQLDKIPVAQRSPAMQRLAREMTIQIRIHQAQANAQHGRTSGMQAAMAEAETQAGDDVDLRYIVANGWLALGHAERGLALLRPLLAQPTAALSYARVLNHAHLDAELAPLLEKLSAQPWPPKQQDLLEQMRLALAERQADAWLGSGNTAAAQQEMARMLAATRPTDLDRRLDIADWYLGAGDVAAARAILEQARNTNPDDPRLLILQGRIARAEGKYDQALADFRQAHAGDDIADMERHRAKGYVTSGRDYLSKRDGAPGISNLKLAETPIEMRLPLGYGGEQFFVQVERVSATAGALAGASSYELSQYGKIQALDSGAAAGKYTAVQSAQGTGLGLGYETDSMRVDIGTTPRDFPVSYAVGGVKWSHYTATTGFSFDLSRRPVTSSLLSYAGAHDPVTGEVWGGVRSTGGSLHLSRDRGRLSGSFDFGYHWLTGQNVQNNTAATTRIGADWSFIRSDDMRLTAGLAYSDWRYREDLSYYTFGQGGYYSPQRYRSLSVPFRWTGREERWSYLLLGSVSVSTSYEKAMAYYPTDPRLQQIAANPIYAGGPGHGLFYALGGTLEYRITPQLYGGARLEFDRTAYYSPNFATLYLRYMFEPQTGKVDYPPQPVRPYSQY